jgi:organic hydroperoxide reductase OsmC/OhrA
VAASLHTAQVAWEGGEDARAHRVQLGEQSLASSSAVEFGGEDASSNPERLLVGALSSCHMLWFLDFARRRGLAVASYEDDAEATLDRDRFSGAVLRPLVVWEGEDPGLVSLDDLHHRAHRACFIANSVSFPVSVQPR